MGGKTVALVLAVDGHVLAAIFPILGVGLNVLPVSDPVPRVLAPGGPTEPAVALPVDIAPLVNVGIALDLLGAALFPNHVFPRRLWIRNLFLVLKPVQKSFFHRSGPPREVFP